MNFIRYKNRKFYSYDQKGYVTIDFFKEKVRSGADIEIYCVMKDRDITEEILSRIYLEIFIESLEGDKVKILSEMIRAIPQRAAEVNSEKTVVILEENKTIAVKGIQ